MRKILFYYSVVATLLLLVCILSLHHTKGEATRLRNNNETLAAEANIYKTRNEESAVSVVAMQLQLQEYREQHTRDTKRIRELGIRLRRVESIATTASQTKVDVSAPLRDTVFLERLLPDTASIFRWKDDWVRIEGAIRNGRAECHIESIDTLRQVVHRIPYKFLFFRYGTKAIRQEIISSNPHTRIVYSEYIELPKRYRRR